MRSTNDLFFLRRPEPPHRVNGSGETLIGVVESFRPGERQRVEGILADLRELDVTELRTTISCADYHSPGGLEWYSWLIPHLARQVNVLPCLVNGPWVAATANRSGSNVTAMSAYPAFVEDLIRRFGSHFDHVQLTGEPAQLGQWDWADDPDWKTFAGMIREAAWLAHQHGKKTVLAGVSPLNTNWLRLMFRYGAMDQIDVVGVQGFPGVWEANWQGWRPFIERVQIVLDDHDSPARIWITETGYSTASHNLFRQVQAFLTAIESPAERVYWYAGRDIDRTTRFDNGTCADERELHFGLKTASGGHKLLSRMWAEHGIEGLYRLQRSARHLPLPSSRRYTLITGGAGFIGSNLANRLMGAGRQVMIFDSLARPGVERNLEWLHERHGDRLIVEVADIRNAAAVRRAVRNAEQAFDFSAQVAVTTSLVDPIEDFEINARGTVGLLEAIRATDRTIPLVFTSTNKVYGSLQDVRLRSCGDRYEPVSRLLRMQGIDEQRPLDFHSPYGCSKGSADQYVLDYARTLGLAAIVFRMSCIYGPRQFGTEDQGWVAHFLIQAMRGLPITLYGDGRQVRDILFVEDLLDAFELAQANMSRFSGEAFNMGGGPPHTISLLELLHLIEELTGEEPVVRYEDWRPADQKYYVSNTLKFQRATGWSPRVSVREGVSRLHEWLRTFRAPAEAAKTKECVGK